jgi:rhodanese-related sulfurtransferase
MNATPIAQIDPTEADRRVADGEAILLDVRSADEYALGHAPSALLVPLPELEGRLAELDSTVPVVAICRSGGRSQTAAELLASHGFDVVNLAGGSIAWQAAGLELVTSDGSPGIVE